MLNESQSVRLFEDERVFLDDYLQEHYEGSFGKFVHACIKREQELIKTNKKKNFYETFRKEVTNLGFGAIFIIFSVTQRNLYAFLILFLFGMVFVGSSLATILLKLKKRM